jgi:membrane dipeptidase
MLLPADVLAARGGRASLSDLIPHLDHLCQLAGNSAHVAIGSDLDGGFGREKCPREIDTHSDLQQLVQLLHARGYTEADVAAIFHENWLRFWGAAL